MARQVKPGGRRVAVAIVAVALMLVAACSGASNKGGGGADSIDQTATINGTLPTDGPAQDGGVLRTNLSSDAPSLDPQKSPTYSTPAAVTGTVYSKLLEFVADRDHPYGSTETRGDLAESYDVSKDGLAWTFHLRKGVKFQSIAPVNGREFTSADVVCTIDRINSLPGVQQNLTAIVTSVATPDPYTAVFKLSVPYAAFNETMASFYMAMLPCEGTRGEFKLADQAIGTGPFMLTDWQRGVQLVYKKNPNYFIPGKPHLDGFVTVIQSDPTAAIAALRSGELDQTGSVTQTLLPSVISSKPELVIRNYLRAGPSQFMFNLARKPFDDYRVRKAISMAIDRQGLSDTFYGGYAKVTGPIPSTLFGGMPIDEMNKEIPYDPEAAKKLLADAGVASGFDVKMLTTDGFGPQFLSQAQWIQQDLAAIGINVTLNILDQPTYIQVFSSKNYDIAWGLGIDYLGADELLNTLYRTGGPRNWFNSSDPTLDQMITDQRSIQDVDQRNDELQKINQYIVENVLTPFNVLQYTGLTTQQPWVHNLYLHPGYDRAYMVDVWLDDQAPKR